MATRRRPGSEKLVGLEAVELESGESSRLAAVRDDSSQQQQFVGWADVEGLPVAHATANPEAYVGIPIDDSEVYSSSGPTPQHPLLPRGKGGPGGVHGDVSLGIGNDIAGAHECALASARRDNEDFFEKKRFTEAQAKARVEADLRAIEVARINARRRAAEGLDMRPHPGNRFEPQPEKASALGEKDFALEGKGGLRDWRKEGSAPGTEAGMETGNREAVSEGKRGDGQEAVSSGGSGGYQCAEYEPSEYAIPEYKSIYDTPSET